MLHAFGFQSTRPLALGIALIVFACSHRIAIAQTTELEHKSTWTYQISIDAWHWNADTGADYLPGQIEQNSNLFLPNSSNKWRYRNVSPSSWLVGNTKLSHDIDASLKMRADQVLGLRIDEAQIQKNFSPYFGIRAGVVDYKTSWCRTYEPDNGWMREIEAICNTPQLRDVTGGAPGFQIFANNTYGDYLAQGQVGLYAPLLLGYAPKEFNNLIPSPAFEVQSNKKYGLNLNALHLQTGLEARLSYIHTFQTAFSPEANLQGLTKQTSDLFYAGLSIPLTANLRSRVTHTQQVQQAVCRSQVAHINSACNLNLDIEKRSSSLEISYQLNSANLFSAGYSITTFDKNQQFFTPSADIYAQGYPSEIQTQQASVAWRREWSNNIFTIIQHIQSKQASTFELKQIPSKGSATGFRMGYRF